MNKQNKTELGKGNLVMDLKEMLTNGDEWTEKGLDLRDALLNFEDPFSEESLSVAAKESGINSEDLSNFFEDKENSKWKDFILEAHEVQILDIAGELKRIHCDLNPNAEWKIKKALAINKSEKNRKQEMKGEYYKKIDEFAEVLKTHFGWSEKDVKQEFNKVMEFRKKISA